MTRWPGNRNLKPGMKNTKPLSTNRSSILRQAKSGIGIKCYTKPCRWSKGLDPTCSNTYKIQQCPNQLTLWSPSSATWKTHLVSIEGCLWRIEEPLSNGTCTWKTNVTKGFFSHKGNLNKPKGQSQNGLAPLGIQYTHKPYCWQVAPQQSLIPLRVCARKILRKSSKLQELFLSSLPFFWSEKGLNHAFFGSKKS